MMKSSRGNWLTQAWRCPRCGTDIDARTFGFDPGNAANLLCPNQACGASFR